MARMTHNALLVLRALAAEPDREMYGFEIMRAIALPSGTVYPLLDRVEAAGWAKTRAEDIAPQDEGRPRRKYYRITPEGAAAVREEMKREAARLSALGVTEVSRGRDAVAVSAFPLGTSEREPEQDRKPASKGPCEHRIRPGAYCTRCGRLI